MNKRRPAELGRRTVRGGAAEDKEAEARRINAQPWEPPPGKVKQQCRHCRYLFAAPITTEAGLLCPDCLAAGTKAEPA
jgi:hypothetical protein